jgi:tau tubulin kinase
MAQELVQLNPGTQVERWTIIKKLGEGGFGAVYKVSDATGTVFFQVFITFFRRVRVESRGSQ